MDGYKNYIRLNEAGVVILGFSSAFPEIATVQDSDICIDEDAPRHFALQVVDEQGRYRYKWDGTKVVERTEEELFDLNAYKKNKIAEFSSTKDNELVAGFISNATGSPIGFGFDPVDQGYLHKKATMLTIDPTIVSMSWKAQMGMVTLTRDEFIQVLKDADAHEETLVYKLLNLEALVLNCADKASVDAIVW